MPTSSRFSTSWLGPRLQFILGFAFLSFLLATVTLTSIFSLNHIRQQAHQAIDVHGRLSELAAQVANYTLLCRRYEKDVFLNIADEQSRAEYVLHWQTAFTDLHAVIVAFEQDAATPADEEQGIVWQTESRRYQAAFLGVERGIQAGTITTPEAANAALEPAKDPIRTLTDSALAAAQTKAEMAQQTNTLLTRTITVRMYLVVGLGLLALMVAVAWSWVFLTRLLRPIAALHLASNKLAAGDFTVRVPAFRNDEIGRLATTFNAMAATIQHRTDALEGRTAHLQEANERQQQLLTTIKQLATPLLPLTDEVVVLPIVGHVDSLRA